MRDDEAPARLSDDEVRTVIRTRLQESLPCNAPTLREAVGGGGTERLVRSLRAVRAESHDGIGIQIDTPNAIAEALPPELEKRLDALRTNMLMTIARMRTEERAAAAAATEREMVCTQSGTTHVSKGVRARCPPSRWPPRHHPTFTQNCQPMLTVSRQPLTFRK